MRKHNLWWKVPSVSGDQSWACFLWGHHFAMSTLLGLLHLLKIFKGWTMSHVPLGLKIKSQASLLGWPLTGRWLRWSFVICKKRTSQNINKSPKAKDPSLDPKRLNFLSWFEVDLHSQLICCCLCFVLKLLSSDHLHPEDTWSSMENVVLDTLWENRKRLRWGFSAFKVLVGASRKKPFWRVT